MTPTVLVLAFLAAAVILALIAFRRMSRPAQHGGLADLGVVSARWISELRRDEPWSGS